MLIRHTAFYNMKKEACLKWQMHPVGFEPTLSCKNEILSLTGLPIPPRMRKKEACAKTIFELTLRKFVPQKNEKTLKQQQRKGGLRYWF